jgi:tight adherence protein B
MEDLLTLFYFAFAFLLASGLLYYFILADRRVERRLNYYLDINKKYKSLKRKKERPKEEGRSLKSITEFIRGKLSDEDQERIEQVLKSAGVAIGAEEYVMLRWFLAVIVGGISYFIVGNIIIFIIGGVIGYMSPRIWISNKRKKRILSFNEGLPDMITTIIGSLRSGYSFSQAMKTVSEECESPIKEEIIVLLKEMSYGVTMEEALGSLNQRMPSNDLELMIQAILIQRQVGGNLSNVLEIIVKTIRERNKLERQVETLTAQGRLSGRVIGVLPVILGFVIYIINPEYMTAFFSNGLGRIAIGVGVLFGMLGFAMINKLTKIEV